MTVQATVAAADDFDPSPEVRLVSATSNEPDDAPGDADGNTTNDVVVVDDDTLRLRAERDENRQRPRLHDHLPGDRQLRQPQRPTARR